LEVLSDVNYRALWFLRETDVISFKSGSYYFIAHAFALPALLPIFNYELNANRLLTDNRVNGVFLFLQPRIADHLIDLPE